MFYGNICTANDLLIAAPFVNQSEMEQCIFYLFACLGQNG